MFFEHDEEEDEANRTLKLSGENSELGGAGSNLSDLSSLATKYEIKSPKFLSTVKNVGNLGEASSSIDKLLNSFFTETMTSKTGVSENKPDSGDSSSLIYQRTKSISFSGGVGIEEQPNPDLEMKIETVGGGAFSLSDIATEFLSLSSTNNNSVYSSNNNLIVDLIDHEFNKQLNLDVNDENQIDLSKQNIFLINKTSREKQSNLCNKLSTSHELSTSISSSFGMSSPVNSSLLNSNKAIQLIPPPTTLLIKISNSLAADSEKSLFILESDSVLGQYLGICNTKDESSLLRTNSALISDQFEYIQQIKSMKKRNKLMSRSRKRLRVELNEPLRVSANTIPALGVKREIKPTSSSLSGLKRAKKSSSSSSKKDSNKSSLEAVKAFDFSLPSPDDLVLAKQKFAFKNLRFK